MVPLIFLGISSFTLSFTISNFITSEILRNRFENEIYTERELFLPQKKLSKVRFNKEIRVRYIPTIDSLCPNTLYDLWYNKNDLRIFKHNYLFYKKYKSI
tara:strand:+ start:114 stop:413 length:300 start_codon:yes stop_codon:yes gene_type:complete